MDLDLKYIDLLLNRCIKKDSKILFLVYNKEISSFIEKLKNKAYDYGIEEIYEEIENPYELHDILKNISLYEIDNHAYFDKSIWDEYAKRDASFMMFETEVPGLMDDIEPEKLSRMSLVKQKTKPYYREMQNKCKLSWCIAAYPGESWALDIYKDDNSYDELRDAIYKMCMVDTDNPIDNWDKHIKRNYKIVDYLNNLGIDKLHYTNSIGTDLTLYLPDGYMFESALDNDIMVNMPSYEVFASPIYNKTEGIVYSSLPLMYQGGIVEEFYLKFENGKVVEIGASKGKDILDGIVNSDSNSCYLGECALVEKDSPIAKMKTVFKTTLIDENASCHLALGAGFNECLKDGLTISDDELLVHGINVSKTHVDFMIGTDDLDIVATLKDGSEVKIFDNGKYADTLLNKLD